MQLAVGKNCIPCKLLKTWLQDNNITGIDLVDVEDNPDFVEKYDLKQTPSLVLDDNTVIAGLGAIQDYFDEEDNNE
jgi:glutathione S-transferase